MYEPNSAYSLYSLRRYYTVQISKWTSDPIINLSYHIWLHNSKVPCRSLPSNTSAQVFQRGSRLGSTQTSQIIEILTTVRRSSAVGWRIATFSMVLLRQKLAKCVQMIYLLSLVIELKTYISETRHLFAQWSPRNADYNQNVLRWTCL